MPSERFVEALNDQIGREFLAAHQYTAVGAYYDRLTFPRLGSSSTSRPTRSVAMQCGW
jgi:ferritin